MKAKIHPKYYTNAQVICACGNTFTTGSTKQQITVEICSACHPFYTGKMRYIDTMGRVEKFMKKQKSAETKTYVSKRIRKKQKRAQTQEERIPRTLKEMVQAQQKQAKKAQASQAIKTPKEKTGSEQNN